MYYTIYHSVEVWLVPVDPVPGSEIFYTIDNTYPMQFGEKYIGEFVIPEGRINLQAQVFINGTPAGRTLLLSREELVERANK